MSSIERFSANIDVFDARLHDIILPDSSLEKLCTGATWSEGPVWIDEKSQLLWSDIPNNRMLSWTEADGISEWRSPSNFTNGHYRDLNGDIIHCSHGGRCIYRTNASGETQVVVDQYQGKKLNSPNDVIVKSDGTIWFSDPPYGILSDAEGYKAESELGDNYVFRYDPKTADLSIITDLVEEPNGLAFSPDERLLYVSDTSAALKEEGGNHHIIVFDVVDGQRVDNGRVFAVVNPGLPDGFRIDRKGWVYTSSLDSIQIIHPDGTLLGKIYVPEKIGNCTFGGPSKNQLYIAASTSIYRVTLNTQGVQTP